MLVKYQAKAKKTVCLLSTMHSDADGTTAEPKPQVINFYNENKVGCFDCFDQVVCGCAA